MPSTILDHGAREKDEIAMAQLDFRNSAVERLDWNKTAGPKPTQVAQRD
jgi:hypothetical protein